VIIGASFGMGKELAHLLADAGYTLGLAARRTSLLNDLADELDTDTFIKKIDISKPVAAARLLQELIDSMGGVDLVVITAGMWRDIDEFEQEDDYKAHFSINFAAEKKAIDTNVVGFTAMCSVALNNFLCQRSGHLVAITSIDALRGNAACPIYSATKSFDSKYLEGIRYKMRERRLPIAITEIRPGYVSTYDVPENAYWVTTPQEAAKQIFKAIRNKQKVAYVSKRWAIVGALMRILPDWLYTSIGGL
jgi:short-subunit dehydrogenase